MKENQIINEEGYRCPNCHTLLVIELSAEGYGIYCPAGACASAVSNDGADGETIQEAYANFMDMMEREEDGAHWN